VIGLNVRKVVEPDTDQGIPSIQATHAATKQTSPESIHSKSEHDQHSRVIDDDAYPSPTKEEENTLRKVYDTIPLTAWSLCLVEMAERASYYGVKAAFNNFMQFPLPEGGPGTGAIDPSKPNSHAGALNLGLQTASALGLLFTFLAYVIPIFGAWIADVKIGRYQAIIWGVIVGAVAHVYTLECGSHPSFHIS
jgi:proton-dependent oligopeptide transporter, POT family